MSGRLKGYEDESNEEDENGEDNNEGLLIKREGKGKGKGKTRFVFGGCSYKSAKKVVLSPLTKFHKSSNFSSSDSSSSQITTNLLSSSSSNIVRSGGNFRCYLCMSNPQTLDLDYEDIDPNDSRVGYESIKSLIEKSEFYTKECNAHFL